MLLIQKLNSLTEDEKNLLLFITNKHKTSDYSLETEYLPFLKKGFVYETLRHEQPNLKDDKKWLVDSILYKLLNIPIQESIKVPEPDIDEHYNLLFKFNESVDKIEEENK